MGLRLGGVSHTPQPIRQIGSTIGEASILACSIASEWPGDNDLLPDEQVGSVWYVKGWDQNYVSEAGKELAFNGKRLLTNAADQ